jgi:hypothetical protein
MKLSYFVLQPTDGSVNAQIKTYLKAGLINGAQECLNGTVAANGPYKLDTFIFKMT